MYKKRNLHFSSYVDEIKELVSNGNVNQALELLYWCVEATEAESNKDGLGVAPWYYEQIAIIYRKQKKYKEEVIILERYANQIKAPGSKPAVLAQRLVKARFLENKSALSN